MERLRAYWRSGCIGKIVLSVAGFLGASVCCGVLVLIAPTPRPAQAPAAVQPTIEEVEPTATPTEPPAATPTQELSQPTAAPAPTAAPTDRRTVRKEDYGDAWPFTVESGVVRCVAPRNEVVFSSGGKAYAVNGTAKANDLYADIGSIWKDDPMIAGAKVSIGPILELGLSLCS